MSERQASRVLVIQPDAQCDLHRFSAWLHDEGITIEVVRPYEGDPVPSDLSADGLIVLGGGMGALDSAEFPWLTDVGNLLRAAVAADAPTLGICLGAQLLAAAMGGEVRRGDRGLESGITEVTWREEADNDPLIGGLPSPLVAGSLHFDAIVELPPAAVHLGVGAQYEHQVFRIGSAWGVQFHPEVSPERFRSWKSEVASIPGASDTFDRQVAEFEDADAEVRRGTRELAKRFALIVRGRAA